MKAGLFQSMHLENTSSTIHHVLLSLVLVCVPAKFLTVCLLTFERFTMGGLTAEHPVHCSAVQIYRMQECKNTKYNFKKNMVQTSCHFKSFLCRVVKVWSCRVERWLQRAFLVLMEALAAWLWSLNPSCHHYLRCHHSWINFMIYGAYGRQWGWKVSVKTQAVITIGDVISGE